MTTPKKRYTVPKVEPGRFPYPRRTTPETGRAKKNSSLFLLSLESGMATDISSWIPEQYGGALVQLYTQTSAVEAASTRREPMVTDIKKIPKDVEATVQFTLKGASYPLDTTAADQIQLNAAKLTHASAFNEEDLADSSSFTNAVNNKKNRATVNLGLLFDNAALAVTVAAGAENVAPYESVYRAVSQYSSGANRFAILTADNTSATKRAKITGAIAAAENSAYSGDLCIIAHPAFRAVLRDLDATGVNGMNLVSGPNGGQPNGLVQSLFGYPIFFSRSLRLSTSATYAPSAGTGIVGAAGNALMVIGPRDHLIIGDRAPLESQYLDPRTGIGTLTDTAYLKMRRRAAFAVGDESAFATVEIATTAS